MPTKRIHSDALEGITKNHEDHRYAAPMVSTGDLQLMFESDDEQDPRCWAVEYLCGTCHEVARQWDADMNDLIRQALKENGIIDR